MKIGIPKEISPGETRVALVPNLVPLLKKDGYEVLLASGAGAGSFFSDEQYLVAGAQIIEDLPSLYLKADIIFKVQPPQLHPHFRQHEAEMLGNGAIYLGFLEPYRNRETLELFTKQHISSFAMEFIPRISRAQNMDALSSMATIAGYKAVLLAADHLRKMFPLLMMAAGTVTPATVLVLGAGVAGLQAIATARRLGARVEAFDPRQAVKEQIMSLGASFVEMELPPDIETAGGYAREQSTEFLKKEQEAISVRMPKVDVIICTAQVFGKQAPLLITEEMVKLIRPGSVIVDLAAEQGGNCALTKAGQTIEHYGVTIIGATNLPATLPVDASQLYARGLVNLFRHLYPTPAAKLDFTDEITRGTCLTYEGEIVHPALKTGIKQGATA